MIFSFSSHRIALRFLRYAATLACPALLSAMAAPAANACDLVVSGGRLYASPSAPAIDEAVVVVSAGRIEAVGTRQGLRPPRGCKTLDVSGKVVVAGFWNSHVHLTTPVLLKVLRGFGRPAAQEWRGGWCVTRGDTRRASCQRTGAALARN